MEDLRWILLGLGALVLLGLYLFSRKRRGEAIVPFGDELTHDPLDTAPVVRRAEPHIEDITHWGDEGVGQVRRRSLDEEASLPRPGQRRTPRFSYEAESRAEAEPVRVAPAPEEAGEPAMPAVEAEVAMPPPAIEEVAAPEVPQAAPAAEAPGASQAPAVVPVYLVSRDPQGFAGADLIDAFGRYGFEYGEMNVFHHADAHGHPLFSLMNGVAPGTFDLANLPGQHTPALALFLRLPIASLPGLVFEQFLDIAHRLAEDLDATLLDERREALSSESIDRMREVALGE